MKVAYYLTVLVVISFFVGFPIVIWRIIRSSRGAPAAQIIRRVVVASLLFWVAGLACAAGLYMFLNLRSDGGPGAFRAMDASQEYLTKKYGSSSDWHLDAQNVYTSADHRDGYYVVRYRCQARTGVVKASYSDYKANKEFTFEEQVEQKGGTP